MSTTESEFAAAEKRLAENEPAEAEPARELRAIVSQLANDHQPSSLAELRRIIMREQAIPSHRRGLLQYVLMDMLDQRELEISADHRLMRACLRTRS